MIFEHQIFTKTEITLVEAFYQTDYKQRKRNSLTMAKKNTLDHVLKQSWRPENSPAKIPHIIILFRFFGYNPLKLSHVLLISLRQAQHSRDLTQQSLLLFRRKRDGPSIVNLDVKRIWGLLRVENADHH